MKQQHLAWGYAGILLAALALGGCSKPGEPAAQAVRGSPGGATAGKQPAGTGLTGSFPETNDPARATRATTGAMGNSGNAPAPQRP